MTLVLIPSTGLAWLGSQINSSSRAKTLEAASAKLCASPYREGHAPNPNGSENEGGQSGHEHSSLLGLV